MAPVQTLDYVPFRYEVEEAIRRLANRKVSGPDGLPAELFIVLADEGELNTAGTFHDMIVAVWRGGGVPKTACSRHCCQDVNDFTKASPKTCDIFYRTFRCC